MINKIRDNLKTPTVNLFNKLSFSLFQNKNILAQLQISRNKRKSKTLSLEDICSKGHDQNMAMIKDILIKKFEAKILSDLRFGGRSVFQMSDAKVRELIENEFIVAFDPLTRNEYLVTFNIKKLIKYKQKKPSINLHLVSKECFKKFVDDFLEFRSFYRCCESWIKPLSMCLLDAYNLDAKEMYLGFSSPDVYQYLVSFQKIEGKIDRRIVDSLIKEIENCDNSKVIFKKIFPLGSGTCLNINTRSGWGVNIAFNEFESGINESQILNSGRIDLSSKKHILLIDDDERFVQLLKKVMSLRGFKVSLAVSVNDALLYHLDNQNDIDLIVTDLHLPKYNGLDLISALRAKKYKSPIIVLTSDQADDTRADLMDAGADIVINKEEDPRVLLVWIKKLLGINELSESDINLHC